MLDLTQLLQVTIDRKASDLHVIPGYHPAIRVNSELFALLITEEVTKEISEKILLSILSNEQKENLLANKEVDFGYEFNGQRFRVNMYYERGTIAAAFRLIPSIIRTIDDLKLPPIFHDFTKLHQGLILVTGPTGEGKSTTLASMVNEINLSFAKHILTIEDPIEFTYPKARSIISQRELHQDTHSLSVALRSVLREDPDVVLLGEMRDYETIQAALTIAETGHLVLSTLHTNSAPETINRIIDVFPGPQQNQVRNQLASSLKVIVSQRLLPTIDNTTRIPALEVLINTPAVAAVVREGKAFMLDNIIETGENENMILFERYLAKLYQNGQISKSTALSYALRPNEIRKFVT